MTMWFYVLGFVAKINSTLWRYRINFIPLNVVVIGIVGLGCFATIESAVDGIRNGSAPQPMSVVQIQDSPTIVQNYVSVSGVEIPEAVWEYGEKGSSGQLTKVDKSWYPLLDRENRRLLLVQKSGKTAGGDAREVTVTGMLREMDAGVRRNLAAQKDEIDGFRVETRYVLVAGQQPGHSTTNLAVSAVLLGILALFGIVTIMSNTVFQVTGRMAQQTSPLADSIRVGATGTFSLQQEKAAIRKRFIDMPAVLTRLDNGCPVLLSNIDASRRFMGVTMSKRAGVWSLPIDPGSFRDPQCGFLYWGTSRKPAFRFAYIDKPTRTRRSVVMTCDDAASLDSAVMFLGNSLHTATSAPLPATMTSGGGGSA